MKIVRNYVFSFLVAACYATAAFSQPWPAGGPGPALPTPAAIGAAPAGDASIPVLSNGKSSAAGMVNALALAQGIPINDGSTHTVGTAPLGTCFYGQTTLAGIVAACQNIGGIASPFFFLTDSGSITGPMGTSGSTTNPFTSPGGAYKFASYTTTQVQNIDIGWLALQACNLTYKCYRPAGTYKIMALEYLPLMIPIVTDSSGSVAISDNIRGDGFDQTVIQPGQDWANPSVGGYVAGARIEWCGDPSGTSGNLLGRYEGNDGRCFGQIGDLSYDPPPGGAIYGSPGAQLSYIGGLSWGARLTVNRLTMRGLDCGFGLVGDHTDITRLQIAGGTAGICYDAPSNALTGDNTFVDMNVSGQTQTNISIDGAASIADSFVGETYMGGAPVVISGNSNGCAPISTDWIVRGKLFTEYTGNRVAHDYNSTPCRSILGVKIENWQHSFDPSHHATTPSGIVVPELFHVNTMQGSIEIQGLAGEQFAPPTTYGTPTAAFDLQSIGNNAGEFELSGELNYFITQLGSIPMFNLPSGVANYASTILLHQNGGWSGTMASLATDGNYASSAFGGTRAGDLLENDQYAVSGGGRNYIGSSPIAGIAMQSGILAGSFVPMAKSGIVQINTGWNTNFWTLWAKGTGIGPRLALVGGSGYTTGGPYTWTATGGGCSTEPVGTVTVISGALASYTITTIGIGCTSAPTITIPAGAGSGTGGSITAMWPGALATNASTPLTVGFVGGTSPLGGNSGVGGGGNYINVMLQGVQ